MLLSRCEARYEAWNARQTSWTAGILVVILDALQY